MAKFEVQHNTICDGWVNCWTTYDDNGDGVPTTYNTYEEALSDLQDYIADTEDAAKVGDLAEPYYIDDFRIVELITN